MVLPKSVHRAMIGKVSRTQNSKRHIPLQLPRDLPQGFRATEGRAVATSRVHQALEHRFGDYLEIDLPRHVWSVISIL